MPEQQGPVYFSGKLGNRVGYKRDGKYFFRNLPQQVNISTGTKLVNADFGTVAKAEKLIRNAIKPFLDIPCDNQYHIRLNAVLLKMLHAGNQKRGSRSFKHLDLSGLVGFQFNLQSKINNIVTFEGMELDRYGNLRMPFAQLKSIRDRIKVSHIEIEFIAQAIHIIDNKYSTPFTSKALIDLNAMPSSETVAKIGFYSSGFGERIIIMQVRALVKRNKGLQPSKSVKHLAAGIIHTSPCTR